MQAVTDADFGQVLAGPRPVLVDFWAPWCAPCRAVAPVLEHVAAEVAGLVDVVKVDVDQCPQTAGTYGIRSIPALVLFVGGQPVDQLAGAVPAAQVMALLEKHVPALGVVRLSPSQLEAQLKAGQVLAVDVRAAGDFERHHIEGAINAPADFDAPEQWQAPATPPGMRLALVDKTGQLSLKLVRQLGRTGTPAAVLEGGVLEWEISGRRLT